MGFASAKTFLFLVLIVSSHLLTFAHICVFTDAFTIYVANKLPPNSGKLLIRCQSGNNDLGYHNLTTNQEFSWSFCTAVFGRTLFFCHFWWGAKEVCFDVFRDSWAQRCSGDQCYWAAQSDGIYLSGSKRHVWDGNSCHRRSNFKQV
ncbi:hypothetical protein F511_35209 [Dorcoceras hygrometricum]|uniref:S-protein homolog n=1 Tax=Dorcoceras hygrometricum TaxID=472368 RepID=A0A2Z7DDT6_9LAMI|nr:hypothetical protein F511_35209 [Dorcoceras hygrometricum]